MFWFKKDNDEDKRKKAEELKNKGNEYSSKGDYKAAIECYNMAVEFDAKNLFIYGARAYAFQQLKQYREAIEDFNKTVELGYSEDYFILANRGYSYRKLEQYDKAIEDCERAIKLNCRKKQKAPLRINGVFFQLLS